MKRVKMSIYKNRIFFGVFILLVFGKAQSKWDQDKQYEDSMKTLQDYASKLKNMQLQIKNQTELDLENLLLERSIVQDLMDKMKNFCQNSQFRTMELGMSRSSLSISVPDQSAKGLSSSSSLPPEEQKKCFDNPLKIYKTYIESYFALWEQYEKLKCATKIQDLRKLKDQTLKKVW
jgi:hypothetical protein